ncbi:MAG: hypothetical protein QOD93_7269 [Acetobacteraceae bacterium]|nr:hypothetical protein [Acetobacteraceae bacterium]
MSDPGQMNGRTQAVAQRLERMRAIAADIRALMPAGAHSSDHADIYDEDGLPWRDGGHFQLTDIESALKD